MRRVFLVSGLVWGIIVLTVIIVGHALKQHDASQTEVAVATSSIPDVTGVPLRQHNAFSTDYMTRADIFDWPVAIINNAYWSCEDVGYSDRTCACMIGGIMGTLTFATWLRSDDSYRTSVLSVTADTCKRYQPR